jgi:transcriptional regulator with XRE-family HTH domain
MAVVDFPRTDDIRLGRGIRRVREARGLTIARLAIETRLDPDRLDLAEHGRARLSSAELHAVINALHAPLELLFAAPSDLSALRRL